MTGIIQRSLSGGEVSPSLLKRGDVSKVQSGVKTLRNWLLDRTGAAVNRPGFRYIGAVPGTPTGEERLIPFVFNDAQTYMLIFCDGFFRVIQDDSYLLVGSQSAWADATEYVAGDVVTSGGAYYYCVANHLSADSSGLPYDTEPGSTNGDAFVWYPLTASGSSAYVEVPSPYALADLADVQWTQSGDILTLTHIDYPPFEVRRTSAVNWTCLPLNFAPELPSPAYATTVSNGASLSGGLDLAYKVTARKAATFEESLTWAGENASSTTAYATNASSTTDDLACISTGAHGLADGDEITLLDVEGWDTTGSIAFHPHESARRALEGKSFRVTSTGASSFTLNDTAGLIYPDPITAYPVTGVHFTFARSTLSFADRANPANASANEIEFTWTAVEGAGDYCVYRSVNDGPFEYLACVDKPEYRDDNGKTAGDSEDVAPQYRNPFKYGDWPRCSAYFQQRQLFAGSTESPQTVWASRTGDFRNFTTRSPLQDDDAIEFTVAGVEANEVVGMEALGQLVVLTNGSVHTVKGDTDGVLKPSAINLERLDSRGAKNVRPILVGDSMVYVQARGSQVREVRYDLERGGYGGFAGQDLTIYATHLFGGHSIVQTAYAEVPDPTLWVLRGDGKLVALTYLREQEIAAWSQHETRAETDSIKSIAVIPQDDHDLLYAVIERSIDGSTVYSVERLAARTSGLYGTDYRVGCRFSDSHLVYDGTNTTATTLALTGGTTWATGEAGLTLTASSAIFPGDASNVGNGYRLVGADGSEVEVQVTTDGSTTVQTVTILGIPTGESAAASSVRSTATASWVAMVDALSGLDHLEGETVQIVADCNNLGTDTVASGAITTLSRPYGVICVGLPVTSDIEALDLDIIQAQDVVADRRHTVAAASVFVEDTIGLVVGIASSDLYGHRAKHGYLAPQLVSGTLGYKFATAPTDHGRITLRQSSGRPAKVLGFVRHTAIGGRIE